MAKSRGKKKVKNKTPLLYGGYGVSVLGKLCHWCKRPMSDSQHSTDRATRDHVHPKTLGGKRMVWCCFACNNLKGCMTEQLWLRFMRDNPQWWKLHHDRPAFRVARHSAHVSVYGVEPYPLLQNYPMPLEEASD